MGTKKGRFYISKNHFCIEKYEGGEKKIVKYRMNHLNGLRIIPENLARMICDVFKDYEENNKE